MSAQHGGSWAFRPLLLSQGQFGRLKTGAAAAAEHRGRVTGFTI